MPINNFTNKENTVITLLKGNSDFTDSSARVFTLMYSKQTEMARLSLIKFLSSYSGLNNNQLCSDAIDSLLSLNLLEQVRKDDGAFYHIRVPSNVDDIVMGKYGQGVLDALQACRSEIKYLTNCGRTNTMDNAEGFFNLLRSAQKEICIVYVATPPYETTVQVIKDVLINTSVKIKLLVADDELCQEYRGKKSSIEEWYLKFKDYKNFEVRKYSTKDGVYIATSTLIDGEKLRISVYDPESQRTADGEMLEILDCDDKIANIVKNHKKQFESIWEEATRYNEPFFWSLLKNKWLRFVLVNAICLFLYLKYENISWVAFIVPAVYGVLIENYIEDGIDWIKDKFSISL